MKDRYALRSPLRQQQLRRFAYRVPWVVDRSGAPHYRIVNQSRQELRAVSLSITGSCSIRTSSPRRIRPGESVNATIKGGDPARDTLVVIRWFTPDDREYLWNISF